MLQSLFLLRSHILILSIAFIFVCASASAQTKTTKYTYDALGRATFVEDSANGNRDYDYDQAGNRVAVVIGQATDDPVLPPAPSAPSGLSCSQIAAGAWRGSWNSVSGASYYLYRTTAGNETTETSTSTVKTASCSGVRACNSSNVCSAKSSF